MVTGQVHRWRVRLPVSEEGAANECLEPAEVDDGTSAVARFAERECPLAGLQAIPLPVPVDVCTNEGGVADRSFRFYEVRSH